MACTVRRLARDEIAQRVAEVLHMTRLDGFGERAIRELSGGQQQRVALARAMVIQPDILLMDEPLGALDRQLRKEVQFEIRRLHAARPRTTIYVTHDQEEALVMSDRIAVMRAGRIVQIGSGADLYERPVDTFVARFLGESNLLRGHRRHAWRTDAATLAVPGLARPLEGRAGRRPARRRARPRRCCGRKRSARRRAVCRRASSSGSILGELVAVRLALASGHELWSRRLASEWSGRDVVEIGWDASAISILPDASFES